MPWILLIFLLLLAGNSPATAPRAMSSGPPSQAPAATVAPGRGDASATRSAVVAAAARTLRENYVFPDVAERMAADLESRQQSGELAAFSDPAAFAAHVTERLQAISKDKHVRVSYSPKLTGQASLPILNPFPDFMNFGFYRVERLPGNIGYVDLRSFMLQDGVPDTLAATMRLLARTDALILDLRKNGGGQMQMQLLLASYFLPAPTRWADTRLRDRPTIEWTTLASVDGPRYLDKPLVILTSHHTFSAAESFPYHLRRLRPVTLVGETTGGAANPGMTVPLGADFYMFVAVGQNVAPGTTENWEGVGVVPDVAVPAEDALAVAQARLLKELLPKTTEPRLRAEQTSALAELEHVATR